MEKRCCDGLLLTALLVALSACGEAPPQALGTLEYDRITLPSPAAERIVDIRVREGEQVSAGAVLMTLERTRTEAQWRAAEADVARGREALLEMQHGARREQIDQARASLAAARAGEADARAYLARIEPLLPRKLVSATELDRARAAADRARAQTRAAEAALAELENGVRREQLAQGEAVLRAAEAQAAAQKNLLEKLTLTAPRDGRIDSLPYRLGDQAPVGAPLVVMLVGDAPYARLYVPEPLRADVQVGDRVRIHVEGRDSEYPGTVRMIRSEPVFTPYYALTGEDAARLSYLAEIQLDKTAQALPAGLPVRGEFGPAP
ncbi:hemolysin D [Isoalcanivorax pacificus W11-5]|uniref:Hemolysin D n=1 Tax=Isoalcanivorax pacificus W11-5 TaxID=391936 RepID=A0A0B4XRN0_9GAMM|nr:HlyD family efflux transporter periplasmic adaptor subunit [Isoalcanivorax pacificus]AJD49856.1 hemolysin D [Isoalcanivorax pacificus W11-5]